MFRSHTTRAARSTGLLATVLAAGLLAGCATSPGAAPAPADGGSNIDAAVQATVTSVAEGLMAEHALHAAIGQVVEDGRVIAEFALGDSTTGVPATVDMRWRNGAVSLAYIATALLRLDEQGVLDIDEPIDAYLPDMPEADRITPRQLITMTAGVPDYVPNPAFAENFYGNVFQNWTAEELIDLSNAQPRPFAPGENWDYSHGGIVILGRAMEAAANKPLAEILQEEVLDPLELDATVASQAPEIPAPFLHAFTGERGIFEDSTFWDPSWTLAEGSIQTTTVGDAAHSFDAIVGRGELLSKESYAELISDELIGFGEPLDGCRTCRTLDDRYAYGLGVALRGDTVAQTPSFGGFMGSVITVPAAKADDGKSMTVAVTATFTEGSVDSWDGSLPNFADELAITIMQELQPTLNIPDPRKR